MIDDLFKGTCANFTPLAPQLRWIFSTITRLVAVDPVLVLRGWEAKAVHPGLRGAAVSSGAADGVPNASVGQPAGVTMVQPRQFPGGVELSHFGDLRPVLLTRLLSISQVHLGGLKVVDFPFEGNTGIVTSRGTSAASIKLFNVISDNCSVEEK